VGDGVDTGGLISLEPSKNTSLLAPASCVETESTPFIETEAE
jgi:hypothetical protein